jgi:hypothetical protein
MKVHISFRLLSRLSSSSSYCPILLTFLTTLLLCILIPFILLSLFLSFCLSLLLSFYALQVSTTCVRLPCSPEILIDATRRPWTLDSYIDYFLLPASHRILYFWCAHNYDKICNPNITKMFEYDHNFSSSERRHEHLFLRLKVEFNSGIIAVVPTCHPTKT